MRSAVTSLPIRYRLINSFEQFYDHIEEDAFQKLHFTHNGRQFYQEKFIGDDDSRAIVFANGDIIAQVWHSNLMYVDASFKIDTNEEFKYQLVTRSVLPNSLRSGKPKIPGNL
ncbi:hypothetical protein NQ318_003356 [Aromia moschata]|uniref:Uncharacterized protein n=1 Tax=Aromia moschata TaxID=1265417 RepID=A0AAV8YA44_9CUCU|nr:hypothetical protein NQ318_003356 [Aromia moschata]